MDEMKRIERRLKLHDMRILMSVVEAGSMGKAAEKLGTSQPAVSRAIADLERALGVPLLDRSPGGIEPTRYGRAIVGRGVAVFDELRQGIKDIEFLADPTTGELRFGCSEWMAGGMVLATINRLTQRHPRMAFHVVTGAGPPLFEELTARNVEFVISRMTGKTAEEFMVVETLFDDSYVVAAGMKSKLTSRRKIELVELLGEPWVLAPIDSFGSTLIAEAFRAKGLEVPRTAVSTLSLNLRNRLLATGRFLTMLPGYAVSREGYPFLEKIPVELPDTRAPVAVVTLRNKILSPLALLFLENLRTGTKPATKRRWSFNKL
jgi:DNA-binding transcriptional LysR family regulator